MSWLITSVEYCTFVIMQTNYTRLSIYIWTSLLIWIPKCLTSVTWMRVVSSLLSGWQVLRGRAQRFKEKVKGCFSSTKFKLLIRNKAKEEELLFTVVCTLLHSYDPKSSLTVSVSSLASFQQQKCPRTREHKRIVALCTDAHTRARTHTVPVYAFHSNNRGSLL